MRENENIPAPEPYEAVDEVDPITGAEYVRFIIPKPPPPEEIFRKFGITHEMPLEIIVSPPETHRETLVSHRETGVESTQIESKRKDKRKDKSINNTGEKEITTTVKEKERLSSSLSPHKKGRKTRDPGGAAPGAPKRKRGGQMKNQNARTHGFYSDTLTSVQGESFESAALLKDLDEEITVMRIKIRSLLANSPDNHTLLLTAMNTLKKMITANEEFKWLSRIHDPDDEDLPAGSNYNSNDPEFDEAFLARMKKVGVI